MIKSYSVKKYLAVIIPLLPFLLAGCFTFKNIEPVSLKDVTYLEFKDNILKVAITATINNPNRFKVKIKDAEMELRRGAGKIGTVTQVEQIELDGRTRKDYRIRVTVEINDMMSGLTSLYRMLMNDADHLYLSGSVHLKSFPYSKTCRIEKLSFRQ